MIASEAVARLVGCDLRLDHLAVAGRARAADGSLLLQADLHAIPLAPQSVDAAIVSEVLEHVADDVGALRQLATAVRPGGRLAITVPHARYPLAWDPINWLLERTVGRPIRHGPLAGIWTDHLRLYTPASLRAVVHEAGLEVLDERACTRRCLPFMHNLVYGLGKPLYESHHPALRARSQVTTR